MSLTAVVITYNEEANLERCLRSIGWVDEIIVVDSFSSDHTVEIARRYTTHILQHVYDGDIPQRELGFRAATGEWLMYVDADEEVTDRLREQITDVVHSPAAKSGYAFLRKSRIFGKWTEHGGWFPDYTFRLFRKDAYLAEPAEVHGGFTVRGARGVLDGLLLHHTYPSIQRYLSKMNDYTSLAVHNKLREDPAKSIGIIKIVFSPCSEFFRKFVSNKGYKDGMHGFVLAVLGALYTFALYAKVWEYQSRRRDRSGLLPPITNVELVEARRHSIHT